jgi:oxygen-dependent protoporphyrinogen oxidase
VPEFDSDVIVVGGGISGLACAWWLQQRGKRVRLLESASRAGGCIGTTQSHGCLFESGPNSILDTSPLISRLLDETAIVAERVDASPAARNRFVLRDGALVPVPLSPAAFLATPLFSARAKLRLLREPFIGRAPADSEETVAQFVRRRLGGEFLDYAINPFVGGVYAGRPEQLSLRAAFPRLHTLEQQYGSLIRGQIFGARRRAREAQKSKHAAAMFSFRNGMETLTGAIARRLEHIELGCAVEAVVKDGSAYTVTAKADGASRRYRARAVVLAAPAYAAAPLVASIAPTAAAALQAIPYPPVAVVCSAYARDAIRHGLDGFGVLAPECEGRQILGSLFSSTLFEGRAPAGKVLLTTFVGGMRQPELARLDDAALSELVGCELGAMLGATTPPEFVQIRRWAQAIPQYTPGHSARMQAIETAERAQPGLFFCANYRGGVSVGDCVASAECVVDAVADFIGRRS